MDPDTELPAAAEAAGEDSDPASDPASDPVSAALPIPTDPRPLGPSAAAEELAILTDLPRLVRSVTLTVVRPADLTSYRATGRNSSAEAGRPMVAAAAVEAAATAPPSTLRFATRSPS